jgi:hypothetical protein
VLLVTGTGAAVGGVEVAVVFGAAEPEVLEETTRLTMTVFTIRRGAAREADAETCLARSAGSAPLLISQDRPTPSRMLATAASPAIPPVSQRVEVRLIQPTLGALLVATLHLAVVASAAPRCARRGSGTDRGRGRNGGRPGGRGDGRGGPRARGMWMEVDRSYGPLVNDRGRSWSDLRQVRALAPANGKVSGDGSRNE